MTRLRNIIALTAFALMVLALPSVASAQWRDRDRNDDYYGNNRNNRNIRATIQNLKNRSRNFERRIERIDDRRDDRRDRNDRYDPWNRNNRNGGYASDNLENLAERFRDAADDLADAYGNGRNLNGSRDEAQRVLQIGSQIDNELARTRSNRNAQREWSQIRYDLRVISEVYGGGNYRNNRSGDWRSRVPFPLPF